MIAGFRRGDRPVLYPNSHSVRTMRPVLETLEPRLLLSGGLEIPTAYVAPYPYSQSGPIYVVPGSPTESGSSFKLEVSDPSINYGSYATTQDPSLTQPSNHAGLAMMAVYGGADASIRYPVQSYGSMSVRTSSSASGPLPGPSGFPAVAGPPVQFVGSVGSSQGSIDYHIPVGPDVAGFRLGVNPRGRSPLGTVPAFDDVALYDGTGQKLAEMNAHWDLAHLASSSLFVSFDNAPAGAEVVLRISSMAAASLAQSLSNHQGFLGPDGTFSDSSDSAASDETAFILTIQEFEKMSSSRQASGGLGIVMDQPSNELSISSEIFASGSDATPAGEQQGILNSEGESPIPSPTTSTPAATLNVRIPTGPLISRGATPLGGILANAATEHDPAPTIDRFDGMLTAYLDGLIDETDLLSDQERLEAGGEAAADIKGIDQRRRTTTLAGATLGNLPLVTSPLMASPDADQSAAFLASLPPSTIELPIPDPIGAQIGIDLVSTEPMGGTRSTPRVASWASAAIGLTLGLTLTSGPYFPDFLNHIRKVTPRRLRRSARRGDASKSPR